MNSRILNISNVSFIYPNRSELILDDISFNVDNEIVGILAPTGAGKTTLLNIISGLLKPRKGSVTIGELKPSEASIKKKIGFSFQDSTLIEWNSVIENVLLPLRIGDSEKISTNDTNKALELITLVGLEKFQDYKCSELSGGMKQRVGLARALITNPDIILFDEPFNKLDFITKSELLIEFRQILKEKNINSLVVTHDIEDAVFISDKILIFSSLPCSLLHTVNIGLKERSEKTLHDKEFIDKVSEIKQLILK